MDQDKDKRERADRLFPAGMTFKGNQLGYIFATVNDYYLVSKSWGPGPLWTRKRLLLGAVAPFGERRIQLVTAPETFGPPLAGWAPTDAERAAMLGAFADYLALRFPELQAESHVRRGVCTWIEVRPTGYAAIVVAFVLWLASFVALWRAWSPRSRITPPRSTTGAPEVHVLGS